MDDCSICFKPKNVWNGSVNLVCGHEFCVPCIFVWSRNNNSCPLCRSLIIHHDNISLDQEINKELVREYLDNKFSDLYDSLECTSNHPIYLFDIACDNVLEFFQGEGSNKTFTLARLLYEISGWKENEDDDGRSDGEYATTLGLMISEIRENSNQIIQQCV